METEPLTEESGALAVLRRGLQVSPGLKAGLGVTVGMAMAAAAGRLVVPLLIQQILDRGLQAEGFRPTIVYGAIAIAVAVIVIVLVLSRATYLRLVTVAEHTLCELRVKAFEHIHRLSLADHTASRRGTLTARVTSDIEQLQRFIQWGAISWVISSAVIVGTVIVMAIFSWQLALVVLVVYSPVVPYARMIQRGQLAAYAELRDRVGATLDETSEIVMGAAVVRAYGHRERARQRMAGVIRNQFNGQMRAQRFFALYLPLTDIIGALALAATVGIGVWRADEWGLSSGQLVAFLFLVSMLLNPITEVTEVLDQTQTALAAWRKVLVVLGQPIEVADPEAGVDVAAGPLPVTAEAVSFRYRTGDQVLFGIDVDIPAGARVAIVGETGSGKTTFARLLARLADPTEGVVRAGGVDLRTMSGSARRRAIRMVPQDGFLFDATIAENVAFGREGATRDDVVAGLAHLGLSEWVERMPAGVDSGVGERGESLSVGERQLVALTRAQLADPGLLILDEATSAVDPETEVALARALDRLSSGRTTITIAHRLSTAESADLVLVFDAGHIVEQGVHADLVAADGIYAGLYASWLGNTRASSG